MDPDARSRSGKARADRWLVWLPIPVVALLILAPMLGTPLGPIDDHQAVAILNAHGGVLPWSAVPGEVAIWMHENRFRPFYWLVRVTEVAAWGSWGGGWYLDRLAMAIVSMVAGAAIAIRFVPRPLAVIAGLLVVVGPQAESWYRLGPQEAIAVPIFLVGGALVVRGRPSSVAFFVLAALTKESFVPIALAATVLGLRFGIRRWIVAATVAAIAMIGAAVLSVHATQPDLYAQARSAGQTIDAAGWIVATTSIWTLWPVLGLAAMGAGWRPRVWAAAIALVLLVGEAYLIAGVAHSGRYLLPMSLIAVGISVAAAAFLARAHRRLGWIAAALLVVVVGAGTVSSMVGAIPWRDRAIAFQASIAELRTVMAAHPGAVLVVELRYARDIEAVYALRHFLPEGSAMLSPVPPRPRQDALDVRWEGRVADVVAGGQAWSLDFVPWASPATCIAVRIGVSGVPPCRWSVDLRGAVRGSARVATVR